MNMTDTKHDTFVNMMKREAEKRGYVIDFERVGNVRTTVIIETPHHIHIKYVIDWVEVGSLTDAAVGIWADFFHALATDPIVQYNRMDIQMTAELANKIRTSDPVKIKNVIFNDPATIVFWTDGTKTVVKCQDGDEFDAEKGLAMAISKKALGNNYSSYDILKKWLKKATK